MEKNKTGKYLKYAIGEIVLVVIGILIALSINNWNENQKLIKNEEELMTSLKKEIKNSIVEIEASIKKNNLYLKTADKLIHGLKLNDKLFNYGEIDLAFNYSSYSLDSPVLDGIIATNSKALIKHRDQLTDFRILKNQYKGISKSQFYLDEFWNSKAADFFITCGISIGEEKNDNKNKVTLKEIEFVGYSKKQFIALLSMQTELHKSWKENKINALKKSKEIIKFLNK